MVRSSEHSSLKSLRRCGALLRCRLFDRRRRQFLLADPACLEARLHDQRFGVVARQIEPVEDAGIAGRLVVLALAPAEQIVGGAAREILDALDAVLAQLHQPRRGDTGDLLARTLDPALLALGIELGLLPAEIVTRPRLQFAR